MHLFLLMKAFIEDHGKNEGADSHAGHEGAALKGLGVLVGLYVFFIGEKLMQWKRSLKEKKVRLF